MSDQLPAELLAEESRIEAAAVTAHRRWEGRRAMRIRPRGWTMFAIGVLIGAGYATLVLAAMRFLP